MANAILHIHVHGGAVELIVCVHVYQKQSKSKQSTVRFRIRFSFCFTLAAFVFPCYFFSICFYCRYTRLKPNIEMVVIVNVCFWDIHENDTKLIYKLLLHMFIKKKLEFYTTNEFIYQRKRKKRKFPWQMLNKLLCEVHEVDVPLN